MEQYPTRQNKKKLVEKVFQLNTGFMMFNVKMARFSMKSFQPFKPQITIMSANFTKKAFNIKWELYT